MFNRIGGIQQEIYPEGLHFRIPWFQYPIIYDIRFSYIISNSCLLPYNYLGLVRERSPPQPARKISKW